MAEIVENKQSDKGGEEKVSSKADRPSMEDVFLKVWALLEAYPYYRKEVNSYNFLC